MALNFSIGLCSRSRTKLLCQMNLSLKFQGPEKGQGDEMIRRAQTNVLGATLLSALLIGCAQQTIVPAIAPTPAPTIHLRFQSTQGRTQEQFMKDRYQCVTETQQSNSYVDSTLGIGRSEVRPSCSAFFSCLAAKGYLPSNTTDPNQLNAPGFVYVPDGTRVSCTR